MTRFLRGGSSSNQPATPSNSRSEPTRRHIVDVGNCCPAQLDPLRESNTLIGDASGAPDILHSIPADGGIAEQGDIVGFIPADGDSPDWWDFFLGVLDNLVCTPSTGVDLCGGGDCSGGGDCNF